MYCLKLDPGRHKRPWVAKITGTSPTFGFERTFVPGLRDYNSVHVGKRRDMVCFFLEQGEVYEVAEGTDDFREQPERYYCRLTARNEVEKLPLEEVMAAIRVSQEIARVTRPKKLSEKIYGEE